MPTSNSQLDTMLKNVPGKTGKTMTQWHSLLARSGLAKHGELMKLLKTEHGVTHGFANLIVAQFRARDAADDDPVANQYAGAKAPLKPIYDALINAVNGFGKDVEIAPKKTCVSLRRAKQFGLIQPSTKTRVDVGLNLRDARPTKRLEASGSFNAMVTHRVRVTSVDDIDEALIGWLRKAYGAAK